MVKNLHWYTKKFLRKYFMNRNWNDITKKINEFRNERHRIRDEKIIDVYKYRILLPQELKQDFGVKYYTNILHNVIANAPPLPCHMIVVRGVVGGEVNAGDIFMQQGFSSTTFDIRRALRNYLKKSKCCFHVIAIPKGTRCLYNKKEKQIILNPGTRRIIGVKRSNDKSAIQFDVVAQSYQPGLKPNKILKYPKINNLTNK